ncbi:unnamed protein product [Rotaria sp. Silwood2]|nr:unnamed protein product [Rotaria sp. Silwood2]CAF3298228.1 unnamed protein product [Rotaria sp. Silwood2]CAF4045690.1 unnamed protein product [Rotaria sp. Silwood2]CAF4165355.1 unnamed protein product [Rotaria sp. Silwood2]CAF4642919.1 unnamed protein product [Rotaria sp. Silwood2]
MVIVLTMSIALLFTVEKPITSSTTITLVEPFTCDCSVINPQITSRIVNGEAAIPNSWPWQLLLVFFTAQGWPRFYCDANLITPKHVLTAEHCVFDSSPRYVGVISHLHIFHYSTRSPSRTHIAERIYVHESYDDMTLNDDVAVICLRTNISLDYQVSLACIAPANLADQELIDGQPLVAIDWGAKESVNHTRPNELQQVRLQFVP